MLGCAESLSRVCLCVTPRTVALQAPLSMGFSRQEYWSGLPCPPPGDLPHPQGLNPTSLMHRTHLQKGYNELLPSLSGFPVRWAKRWDDSLHRGLCLGRKWVLIGPLQATFWWPQVAQTSVVLLPEKWRCCPVHYWLRDVVKPAWRII